MQRNESAVKLPEEPYLLLPDEIQVRPEYIAALVPQEHHRYTDTPGKESQGLVQECSVSDTIQSQVDNSEGEIWKHEYITAWM